MAGRSALSPGFQPAEPDQVFQPGERDVGAYGEREEQSLIFAILGQQRNTGANGIARPAYPERRFRVTEIDPAAICAVGAEDSAHRLGASRTHQTGESEYLSPVQIEADII